MYAKNSYLKYLGAKISLLRIHMIYTANFKGLNHSKTIKCSQQLDKALNKYQEINSINKMDKNKKALIRL